MYFDNVKKNTFWDVYVQSTIIIFSKSRHMNSMGYKVFKEKNVNSTKIMPKKVS
jgi:hypothetical protein